MRSGNWILPSLAGLGVALVAIFIATHLPTISTMFHTKPTVGGLWVEPGHNQTVGATIHFVVRAYAANHTVPQVDHVLITVSWKGRPGPWLVACQLTAPTHADFYECDWTPSQEREKVPVGDLNVSFDVYDTAGGVNYSPNAPRTITFSP